LEAYKESGGSVAAHLSKKKQIHTNKNNHSSQGGKVFETFPGKRKKEGMAHSVRRSFKKALLFMSQIGRERARGREKGWACFRRRQKPFDHLRKTVVG